jgi:hypothetical protein
MTPKDGADAIAKAASTLKGAKDFSKSVNKQAGVPDKADAPKTSPAAAPAAKPAATGADKEISDVASGLKWKQDQVDAVTPKYHKGGKIKKDGEQVIDAQKGETVLPNKGKKRATELAMKHLDGMKDGMEHAAKKHVKPMHAGKKHHSFKRTTIEHHPDGSHTTEHEHETDSSLNQKYATPDHDSMMDGMMQNTSAPNPGEPAAEAGPAAGPAAGAPQIPGAAA